MEAAIEDFPSRLKSLQSTLESSQRRFAQKIDFSDTSFINYVKHGTEPPARLISNILREYPRVSPRWLLTGDGEMFEQEIARQQREAAFEGVPVVGEIAAGQLVESYTTQHAEDFVQLDAASVASSTDLLFGLRVHGRSMEQWMFEGDVALCSSVQPVRRGDDVCVYQFASGESTVKRLERFEKQKGRIDLRPVNPAFDSFSVSLKEHDQVKKVIGVWRDYRLLKRRSDRL